MLGSFFITLAVILVSDFLLLLLLLLLPCVCLDLIFKMLSMNYDRSFVFLNRTLKQYSSPMVHTPLVESLYLVLTRMPGESCRRRLRSLFLCLCDVDDSGLCSCVCVT